MNKKMLDERLEKAEAAAKRSDEKVTTAKEKAKEAWVTVDEIKKMIEDVQQKQFIKKLAADGLDLKKMCDFIDANKDEIVAFNGSNIKTVPKEE
jgi:phenylalanine-4-hydroxylase